MIGLIIGIVSVSMVGLGTVGNFLTRTNHDIENRKEAKKKYEEHNNPSCTYIDYYGVLRDLFTNEQVEVERDLRGHTIAYTYNSRTGEKKFLRDITEEQKSNEFEKAANDERYNHKNTVKIYKLNNEILEEKGGWEYNKEQDPLYVEGDRYRDLKTRKLYVIRKVRLKSDPKKETFFYMDISNGHFVRRTDGQVIKDGLLGDEENAIPILETDKFIETFNRNKDNNYKLIDHENPGEMSLFIWHQGNHSTTLAMKELDNKSKYMIYKDELYGDLNLISVKRKYEENKSKEKVKDLENKLQIM